MILTDLIKEYLNEAEISQNKFFRLTRIAIRGLKDMHMDVSGFPSTVQLTFNENTLTSPLPNDYISYRKIGYVQNGVIVPFAVNNRLKLYPSGAGCEPTNNNNEINNATVTGFPQYPYWGEWYNTLAPNAAIGGFFNVGGSAAYRCDFRIDEPNAQIQFGINPNCDIVMEYLANPEMVNGKYTIHAFDASAILAWIAWRDIENKSGVPSGEKERKKFEYYRERGLARKRHYALTLSYAYQGVRQTNKSAPQF